MLWILVILIAAVSFLLYIEKWNNVQSVDRNEIVFADRNQAYGAYQIRKRYDRTIMLILFGMIAFIGLGIGVKFLMGLKSEEIVKEPVLDMTTIDLTPPPAEKDQPPPPPPPPPPPLMKTIAFVPPVIKDDAVETDPPPPQDKIADTQVDTKDQDGDGDVVAPPSDDKGDGLVEPPKKEEPFLIVEEMPEFPGGQAEMMKYIQKNVQYPQMAKEAGISGKCFCSFVVAPSGDITDVKVVKGVPGCGDCDKEAMRVIRSMPNWKPGKQTGRSVPVRVTIPINYTLK